MIKLLFAAVLAASVPAQAAPSPPRVVTTDGEIEGTSAAMVEAFLGIPYGADTGGPNRFLPPKPAAAWTGVRPATAMGHRCPQITHKVPLDLIKFSDDPIGEDCLVLNIWKPAGRVRRLPVMVWIHGGGFGFGSANDPLYHGTNLARAENVIVVSINHRINALGYLDLGPEAGPAYAGSSNVGQLDIVLALKWIRANIARFGGDASNVTLFGQSGGGAKIATLLAMPAAEGLFAKAIVESGAVVSVQTPQEALAVRDKLLAKLGLKPAEVLKLRDIPLPELSAAIDSVGMLNFKPWVDGQVIPRQPFTPNAPSSARKVPIMVGTTRDEATAILIANPIWPKMDEATLRMVIAPIVGPSNVERAIALYKARRPADTAPQLFASIFTDYGFIHSAQVMATRQAANGAAGVWAFRTDWQSPVLSGALMAPHGVELPFVFDTAAPELIGPNPPPGMVKLFQRSFAAFARTGNPRVAGMPAWPRYDAARRQTFIYDNSPRLVSDPDPQIREFWDLVTNEPSKAVR